MSGLPGPPAPGASAVELTAVDVRLRGRAVLSSLNLTVAPGECRALVGLNGAGKTTALRVILGMLRPDGGTARLWGTDIRAAGGKVWERVGHVIETPFCYPELTARENIDCSAYLHCADRRRAGVIGERLSESLGLQPWLDVPVRRMSLGTRQKVALVGALAHEPDLAVLDEPTNGLDPLAVVALREIMGSVTERGGAVLVTSHHFDEIARVAARVDVLHAGRVVDTLTPDGPDLERTFFEAVLSAERTMQDAQ